MKSVEEYLFTDEKVERIVSVHEIVFMPPLLCLVASILFFLFFSSAPTFYGFCSLFLGFFWMVYALQRYVAHKIVITNQRFLVHYGIIKEGYRGVSYQNVVAAQSEQGRIGRWLGFGKIVVMTSNGDRYGYPTFRDPDACIEVIIAQIQKTSER